MKAQNSAERSKAFSNFLIFFIITIGVILTCVFFSFQVPLKESEQFRAERDTLLTQKDNREYFQQRMENTMSLLESVNSNKADAENIDANIGSSLSEMRQMINDKMSISERTLYDKIISALSSWRSLQTGIRDISKDDKRQERLLDRIKQLELEVTLKQNELNNCLNQR
jgi:hypothetical protein